VIATLAGLLDVNKQEFLDYAHSYNISQVEAAELIQVDA